MTYAGDFRSQHGRVVLSLENKSVSEQELRNVLLDIPTVDYLSVKPKLPTSTSIAGRSPLSSLLLTVIVAKIII